MDYFLLLTVSALPSVIVAGVMKPDFIRYLKVAIVNAFLVATLAINLPSFIEQFRAVMATPGALMNWGIYYIAFFFPSFCMAVLGAFCVGGIKVMIARRRP